MIKKKSQYCNGTVKIEQNKSREQKPVKIELKISGYL